MCATINFYSHPKYCSDKTVFCTRVNINTIAHVNRDMTLRLAYIFKTFIMILVFNKSLVRSNDFFLRFDVLVAITYTIIKVVSAD